MRGGVIDTLPYMVEPYQLELTGGRSVCFALV